MARKPRLFKITPKFGDDDITSLLPLILPHGFIDMPEDNTEAHDEIQPAEVSVIYDRKRDGPPLYELNGRVQPALPATGDAEIDLLAVPPRNNNPTSLDTLQQAAQIEGSTGDDGTTSTKGMTHDAPSIRDLVKLTRKWDPTSGTYAYQLFDPALPTIMEEPIVILELERAWQESNPHGNFRDKLEQGGWVIRAETGTLRIQRVPAISSNLIRLGDQPANAIMNFHTHPNIPPNEALAYGPSKGVIQQFRSLGYTVPGIVRSHLGYHVIRPEE